MSGRIYVAGPIHSPVPVSKEVLKRRFYTLSDYLRREKRWEPVNPLEVPPACVERGVECQDRSGLPSGEGHSWECWMRGDLIALLSCDSIVLLPYWHESSGASFEHEVAKRLHLPMFTAWPVNARVNEDGALGWDVMGPA